jgi:short subunit dehydrogenase-like uncharacterized protein
VIGLLGATGYTGMLTGEVLAAAGVPFRRGARSATKLAALPRHSGAEDVVVDTNIPAQLDAFLDGCEAVISTVGPFELLGRPVIEAAIRTRTPYVDSTGEPSFLRWLFATHRDAPVPLVPACGFEYIPGDLAVAVASDRLGGPDRIADVLVGYELHGIGLSQGTLRTVVDSAQRTRWRPRKVMLPFAGGERPGVVAPWGEEITVPLRSPNARVRTGVRVPGALATGLQLAGPVIETGGWFMKATGPLMQKAIDRAPAGPDQAMRHKTRYSIVADVRTEDGHTARAFVDGGDGYGLTAELLVACAQRVAKSPAGARATGEAFDAAELLDAVSGPRLRWTVC